MNEERKRKGEKKIKMEKSEDEEKKIAKVVKSYDCII